MKELKRSSFAFMLQAHEDLFGYWLMALAFTLWRKSVQQEKELSLQPKLKDYRMEANEKNTIVTQKWLDGISYEIAFWKKRLQMVAYIQGNDGMGQLWFKDRAGRF